MNFSKTPLEGIVLVEPERLEDTRGHFARTWCMREFAENNIAADFVQCSTSFNKIRGTLRGLHFQSLPYAEAKLVRCTRGRLWDVVVDIRSHSPTKGAWWGVELSASGGEMIFIAEGFAHGFQTLEDDTEIFYQITAEYRPEAGRGIRWNDPDIGIEWPISPPTAISDRDRQLPHLRNLEESPAPPEPVSV